MSVCYFVSYYAAPHAGGRPDALAAYYLERHAPLLRELPAIRRLEVFTPADLDDPRLNEPDGPVLVARMTFDTLADLEDAAVSPARLRARDDMASFPPFDGAARHQALAAESVPLAGGDDDAPTVYHVEYHRPARDEAAFIAHYRASHMPLLAQFPGIRRVAAYTPVGWADAPFVTRNDLMLVNEVAFDSPEAMAAALESDARDRVRADFHAFPPFDGPVTHTPMRRHVLLG